MFDSVKLFLTMLMLEGDGAAGGGDGDAGGGDDAGGDDKGSLIGGDPEKAAADEAAKKKADDEAAAKKAADDKGDKPGDDDKSKDAGAPEKYADFTMPQGVKMDSSLLEAALPVFKEQGLSQAQAQAIVNLQTAAVEEQMRSSIETSKKWDAELKADSALGGANFPESVAKVRGLLVRAAGNDLVDLQEFFNSTGYGNYPPLFRFLHKLATSISEDAMPGPGGGTKDLTPAEAEDKKLRARYPKMGAQLDGAA